MAIVNLSAPWFEYYRELVALFKGDPDVSVIFDSEEMKISVYVNDSKKADALGKIVKNHVEFGNVAVDISVIPADEKLPLKHGWGWHSRRQAFNDESDVYVAALGTNPAVTSFEYAYGPGGVKLTYIVFRPEVIQFFNDDTSSYYGLKSMLYEDIAKNVLNEEVGVFFCTDIANEEM